jgi:phage baseplate assembly protein W
VRLDLDFPFHLDRRGRTADVGYDGHVRDLVEQLLFTSPGERVMRPDFGCGLLDLVFEPNSPELAATLQLSVQAALHRWLGDVLEVEALGITSADNVIRVELSYVVLPTGSRQNAVFEAGDPA